MNFKKRCYNEMKECGCLEATSVRVKALKSDDDNDEETMGAEDRLMGGKRRNERRILDLNLSR